MFEFKEKEKETAKKQDTKQNNTGIPMQLKQRLERQSGFSFDDVQVHYNSDRPAKLDALAYTQGNEVYIGPGQEKHLPHELGHVVQQKMGIVRANTKHSSGVEMNTEERLERQADEIGAGRIQYAVQRKAITGASVHAPVQRAGHGNVVVLNNNVVAKLTSKNEAAAYNYVQPGQGDTGPFNGMSPEKLAIWDRDLRGSGHDRVNGVDWNQIRNQQKFDELCSRLNRKNCIIFISNVIRGNLDQPWIRNQNQNGNQNRNQPQFNNGPVTLDIKIGYKTASKRELRRRGHIFPSFKKWKMNIADSQTGSIDRGYRYIPDGNENRKAAALESDDKIFRIINGKLDALIRQDPRLNKRICVEQIIGRIDEIRNQISRSDITFVAASIFITIRRGGIIVKLIDLDHPIRRPGPGGPVGDTDINASSYDEYNKYKGNLIGGLIALTSMLKNKFGI